MRVQRLPVVLLLSHSKRPGRARGGVDTQKGQHHSTPESREVEMTGHRPGGQGSPLIHPLSWVRQERGWTYQDLAHVIATRVGNSAARREKAWRWEHWGVVPDSESQLALAAELGVSVEVVHTLGWPHWLPIGERINIHAPWTAESCLRSMDGVAGSAVLDRRGFLTLGLGAAAGLADQWLSLDPPQLASVLHGGAIDAELVTCLEQRLPALRQMDAALGGGHIRNVVDAELRLVTNLLAKGTYTERLGKRAFSVAAELGRIAGWTSFDSGYHAAAERYWISALRAAHTADNRAVGANVLKCMSLQRMDADRTDEALSLARAAREGAKSVPARVLAMLTVRQARTHAVRNEVRDCEQLLSVAERAMDRAEDEVAPAWASYFDQAEYCAQVAACYLALERREAADQWLAQSLATQSRDCRRDRATYLIWRADSVLGLGDVEHACELVSRAVPDIADARSVRNQNRLAGIHTKIKKYRHPAVSALDDQLHSLVA